MSESLALTKLIVHDLDAARDFYAAVCGFSEMQRLDGELGGRKITELMMNIKGSTTPSFILFKFHDQEAPKLEECILIFTTDDIDAFADRVTAAGGSVFTPAQPVPDYGFHLGLYKDREGHFVQAIQFMPQR